MGRARILLLPAHVMGLQLPLMEGALDEGREGRWQARRGMRWKEEKVAFEREEMRNWGTGGCKKRVKKDRKSGGTGEERKEVDRREKKNEEKVIRRDGDKIGNKEYRNLANVCVRGLKEEGKE